ncbi:glucosamine-6-phosphate deaminase [Aggregicoccus sp. 17bor-14]|uniref:glucosamine-6-phosphate deaminase n=1 Tax=Myxococcaceae TaxID=31 RepID=UPI0012F3D82A|nr:glucosamine-6-phosphate deaminase [Simulacricoccus sp. 17bor-14]MRI88245.1 glucosamine-6-phosphate deaminase [Aggregicoccus sp. 17bor-14]
MNLRLFASSHEASLACAALVADALHAEPDCVLGLPTGRTPLGVYRELVRLHRAGQVDFSRARTFNLDEFLGLPRDDPGSFRAYMDRQLFQHVNLAPAAIGFLDGRAEDAEAECARYERALADAGGLDLLLLGLGGNGHLAFNEPAEALQALTHRVRLTRETRVANAALFGDEPSRVPLEALTLGMRAILHSRRALLLAFGESKAEAVRQLVLGPLSTRCPASLLQLHPEVNVWLDPAAARLLPEDLKTGANPSS